MIILKDEVFFLQFMWNQDFILQHVFATQAEKQP